LASSNNVVVVAGSGSSWSNSGTLTVAVGGSGTLTVADGGSVVATGGINIASQLGSFGTLNIGALGGSDTAGTVSAPTIALGAGTGVINFNRSDSITISSTITGSVTGAINQLGAGTTILSGNNSGFSGLTTISGGTLQYGDGISSGASVSAGDIINNATLAFNPASTGTNTVAGNISGTGSVNQLGSGTTILSGSNSYSGTTTISAGAILVGDGGTSGTLGSGAVVVNNAALAVNRSDEVTLANAISGSGFFVQVGAGTTILTGDNSAFSGPIGILGGTLQYGDGSTAGTSVSTGDITNYATLAFNPTSTDTYTVAGNISETGSVIMLGSGTTILSGSNSYSGTTTISAGTLAISNGSSFGSSTVTFASNGTTVASLASMQVTNDYVLTGNGTMDVGAFVLTNTGVISGAGSLTKAGAGTLLLSASNSYSGGTWISGGTLTAANLYAFGAGALTIGTNTFLDLANYSIANTLNNNGGTILNAGTISGGDFTGGTTALSGNNSTVAEVSGTATVNVAGSGSTIANVTGGTVNVNAAGTTIESYNGGDVAVGRGLIVAMNDGTSSGVISGDGGLTKNSTGVLTLGGVNTYTGATTVADGKLVVDGSIANSAVTVQNGGTLGGSGTVGDTIVHSGGTINPGNSPGTLNISGNINWLGGGNYNWQVLDASGTAGAQWDLISASGNLDLSALTVSSQFNINLWSLDSTGPDVSGAIDNFDPNTTHTWTILTAGGITGYTGSGQFAINTASINGTDGFQNALASGWGFNVVQDGSNLNLVYSQNASGPSPVPEPGTWAAAALLVGGAAFMRWRKRNKVS
jgi:fibronectin-binding autotransporter adhesin